MEIISQTLINVLSTILVGMVSIVMVQVFTYLRNKTSLIQDEGARNIANNTLDQVEKLINSNITAVDSTIKPEIINAISDGKVEKSELNKLSIIVKENVLNQLGSDSLDILNNTLGDLDQYMATKIEQQLAILKQDETSPVTKTVL